MKNCKIRISKIEHNQNSYQLSVSKRKKNSFQILRDQLLTRINSSKWDDTRRRDSIFHPQNPSDRKSICFDKPKIRENSTIKYTQQLVIAAWALSRKNDYFVFPTFHITFRVSMHREIFTIRILFSFFFFDSDLSFVASPMLCVIATPGSLMRDSRIGSNDKQVVNFSLPENADFTREGWQQPGLVTVQFVTEFTLPRGKFTYNQSRQCF